MSLFHHKISNHVYHIGDGHGNFCTLLIGNKYALLFDTLTGYYDLKSYIEDLTKLDIIVVNSHVHFDHIGGNYQFSNVFYCNKDYPLFDYYKPLLFDIKANNSLNIGNIYKSMSAKDSYQHIDYGHTFDLGGITLVVVNLQGHTAGSIGLFCPEEELLLVGDAISPQMCIFFPESLTLSTLEQTFSSALKYSFKHMLLSHFAEVYPKEIIYEFQKCIALVPNSKHYQYNYSLFPTFLGDLYIQEIHNPVIQQMICIITKPFVE